MNSTKRYTNQTFTKRVDHEGGLHRTAHNPAEPAVCKGCSAVFSDGRWASAGVAKESSKHEHWRPAVMVTCPACKQIESGVVGGYVSVSGIFLTKHRSEILNLVENEAERALEDNPLSRIMNRRDSEGQMLIETTTEHLAQRLGRSIKKAFSGDVSYDFSHENKVARVSWHRD